MPLTLVEGWTAPIEMTLKAAGVERDLTGASVELRLYDKSHDEILEAGATDVIIAASGRIQFVPSGTDFVQASSPYYARVGVVDALGRDSWHPSDDPDVWTVRGVGP